MRKLIILMLVLGMASLANATVIDVVTDGVGSMGRTGTSGDVLINGETIGIKIVLNHNPNPAYPGSPTYDGYLLSTMDLQLSVSGVGTLAEKGTGIATKMKHHTDFGIWVEPEPAVSGNAIAYLTGTVAGDGIQGQADLVWNLVIHAGVSGSITVDLTLHGVTEYSETGYPINWIDLDESDLGDLMLYVCPEPMSIVLLGLGGLTLLRKRRT